MIVSLLLVVSILLFLAHITSDKLLINPPFVFATSFMFSCTWAVVYSDKWELGLHANTFFVISFGILEFIIVCAVVHRLMDSNRRIKRDEPAMLPQIALWKYLAFIAFELLTILLVIRYMRSYMHLSGTSSIAAAIFRYRDTSLKGIEDHSMPLYLYLARLLVNAGGYWFSYVLAGAIIKRKKFLLDAIIVLLAMINTSLLGGRNGILNLILAVIVSVALIYLREHGFSRKELKFTSIIKIGLIAIVVLLAFRTLGQLLGRNTSSETLMDYMAKYCGAPIKNLDIFLQKNRIGKSEHNQTFIYLVHWLGSRIGMDSNYVLDLPYNRINNFNLGNVSTTFYPYIYDYGYLGIVPLIAVMAIILQIVYENAKRFHKGVWGMYFIVVYSYLFNMIVFSFFSNKFYEGVFTASFFRQLIIWAFYSLFFCKVRIKIKR